MKYAYLFEARGIQRYLFGSGKLKDMLGGSELLDYVCADGGYLDQTLDALGLTPQTPRRAGGTFYLLFDDAAAAQRMRNAWRLAADVWLPGLEKVDALAEGASAKAAIDAGIAALHAARNRMQADLPAPGPFSERSQRTGLAATAVDSGEAIDRTTARQRGFKRRDDESLSQRFLREPSIRWPSNFEENAHESVRFPLGSRRLVGLIHIDGNGLGLALRALNAACAGANDATYTALYKAFSEAVSAATTQAAQQASRDVLLPQAAANGVLPARPLILGGDDVSIIVKAELALDFTCAYLKAFEQFSRAGLDGLRNRFKEAGLDATGLPDYLTACAGITFMKSSQPFLAGYQLAEDLCQRAKAGARRAAGDSQPSPAALAFHKIQDSLLTDARTQFEQSHAIQTTTKRFELGLPVYFAGTDGHAPSVASLEALAKVFSGPLNDRPLRELATLWHADANLARQAYTRWRDQARKDPLRAQSLKHFDAILAELIGTAEPDLPCNARGESPLSDVLNLLTIQTARATP